MGLLRDHGLELDPFGVPVHKPVFRFFDMYADLISRFGKASKLF